MKLLWIIWIVPCLAACSHTRPDIVLDGDAYDWASIEDEAPFPVELVETLKPIAMPGQLKLLQKQGQKKPDVPPEERIEKANAAAKIEPVLENYVNAVQVYPFMPGALYQLYAAPEQVTDIALQTGEKLISVSAGDTVRWVLGDTISGLGDNERVHILIKPIAPDLATNLVITTDKRAYHIEMRSYPETYMAALSWTYPHDSLVLKRVRNARAHKTSDQIIDRNLSVSAIKFRYEIEGDKPHWRPLRAFDDGNKVYIQFPSKLAQGEAPPLFVLNTKGGSELVNYRVKGSYYIVDRLFAAAELRLGEKPQQVVRITRTDLRKDRT